MGNSNGEPHAEQPALYLQGGSANSLVGKALTHPGSSLTLLVLARKGNGPFLSVSHFELMRLQVWVNYFVQGHAATEGSQSTIHFTYCYAAFYFILPGRASGREY